MSVEFLPKPGHPRAIECGCRCPVLDNAHGHNDYPQGYFVISSNCKMHWLPAHVCDRCGSSNTEDAPAAGHSQSVCKECGWKWNKPAKEDDDG